MKILHLIWMGFLLLSCRGEAIEDLQKVDQVLNIYVKNAEGKDLLNTKLAESYYSIEFKDMQGEYDREAISLRKKQDANGVYYYEYIVGAKRILLPNATDALKTYKSIIAVQYRLTTTSDTEEQVMEIFYKWTPTLFQLETITYDGQVIFEKSTEGVSVITIEK